MQNGIRLTAAGVTVLATILFVQTTANAFAGVRYVDANSPRPTPPYTNWAMAARVIQEAVDAAAPGDEIVVTNGTYASGGRAVGTNALVNRVAVEKPLTLRSANGPEVTLIQGYHVPGTTNGCGDGAIRCAYLADGAALSGFTLTNGAARLFQGSDFSEDSGGGVWCQSEAATISNCVLVRNAAGYAGGAVFHVPRDPEQLHPEGELCGTFRRRGLWQCPEQLRPDRQLGWRRICSGWRRICFPS
jgi:hypothetical protein